MLGAILGYAGLMVYVWQTNSFVDGGYRVTVTFPIPHALGSALVQFQPHIWTMALGASLGLAIGAIIGAVLGRRRRQTD
jgi:hypothetical protein